MQTIHLGKKKIIELNINGMDCVAVLDNYSIDHFQKNNKRGLLSALDSLKQEDMTTIIQLLGSIIREKKTNKILGAKYLKQFDTLDIIAGLFPVITEIFPDNLPEPSKNSEKK